LMLKLYFIDQINNNRYISVHIESCHTVQDTVDTRNNNCNCALIHIDHDL